jgi:hypothetical protein
LYDYASLPNFQVQRIDSQKGTTGVGSVGVVFDEQEQCELQNRLSA